ncbi:ubiquitin carboxyl-terminal hydrolase-like protein 10 [Elsinoe australis]|uniref:Ubiquitin carboxyl-terminal hydrolase-like protein 10 n=1 Tax=Elsinoe australis TaxID=40998 RepID=A0A4U7B269_9PEZI|nr:ubiquitin carboxyl-terminal hydrolase-like protein 10 [Elsinoe australis]
MAHHGTDSHIGNQVASSASPTPHQLETPSTPENGAKRRRLSKDHPSPKNLTPTDTVSGASPSSPPVTDIVPMAESVGTADESIERSDPAITVIPEDDIPHTFPFIGDEYPTPEVAADALVKHLRDKPEPDAVFQFADWMNQTFTVGQASQTLNASNIRHHINFWTSVGKALRCIMNSSSFKALLYTAFGTCQGLMTAISRIARVFIRLEAQQAEIDAGRRDSVAISKENEEESYGPLFTDFLEAHKALLEIKPIDFDVLDQSHVFPQTLSLAATDFKNDQDAVSALCQLCQMLIRSPHLSKDEASTTLTYLNVIAGLLRFVGNEEDVERQNHFVEHVCRLFISIDSHLIPKLSSSKSVELSVAKRIDLIIGVCGDILEHILLLGTDVTNDFETADLPDMLAWTARNNDPESSNGLTPTRFLTIVSRLDEHGSTLLAYAWSIKCAVRYLERNEPAEQVFGVMLLAGLVSDAAATFESTACHQHRVLVGSLISSCNMLSLVFRSNVDHKAIEKKELGTVLHYLIHTGTYHDDITTQIWDLIVTTREHAVRRACVNRLDLLVQGDLDPPHISYLLTLFATANLGLPWLRLESLMETCAKCLRIRDLYTEYPGTQVEIVHILKSVLRALYALVDVAQEGKMVAATSNALKLVVNPRFPDNNLLGIVRECLVEVADSRDPASTGSVQVLLLFLQSCSERLFRIIRPDDLALQAFDALSAFVQHYRDHPFTDAMSRGLTHRVQLVFSILEKSPEKISSIDSGLLWDIAVGKDAIRDLPSGFALGAWHTAAVTSIRVRQLLADCVKSDKLDTANSSASTVYPAVFEVLGKSPEPLAARRKLLIPMLHASLDTDDATLRDCLRQQINVFMFATDTEVREIDAEEIQREVARVCVEKFISGNLTAGIFLMAILETSRSSAASVQSQEAKVSRQYATKDEAHTMPLQIHRYVAAQDIRRETWVVDQDMTLSDLESRCREVLEADRIKVLRLGHQIKFSDSPSALLSTLPWLLEHPFYIASVDDKGLASTDKSVGLPRTTIEQEIWERYWDLYENLYNQGYLGQLTCTILSAINFQDPDHPTRYANVDRSLDHTSSPSAWKTMFAIKLIGKNLDHQKTRNFQDSGMMVKSVQQLTNLLFACGENFQLLSQVTHLLREYLVEVVNEETRSAYFEDAESVYQLLIRFVEDIRDHIQRTQDNDQANSAGVAMRNLLFCLYEMALCSDKILDDFTTDADAQAIIKTLLGDSNHFICDIVCESIHRNILCMPDPDTEAALRLDVPSPFGTELLNRAMKLKIWAFQLCNNHLSTSKDDPSASFQPFFVTASSLKASVRRIIGSKPVQNLLDDVLHMMDLLARREQFHFHGTESKVGSMFLMLNTCASHARAQGQQLVISENVFSNLQSLLFDHKTVRKEVTCEYGRLSDLWARDAAYNALLNLSHHQHNAAKLVHTMQSLVSEFDGDEPNYPGRDESIRASGSLVGLENMSMTCYLNSLLQQLFINIDFRRFILNVPITDADKQQVLKEVQKTFFFLQNSCRTTFRPDSLCNILGIDVTQQEDAQLYFATLIGRLEDEMLDEHAKKTFKSFYYGRERSQIQGSCRHVSDSTEEFLSLTLTIRNKQNLQESLADYVQGEKMEDANKFRCSKCESLQQQPFVDAVRRTRLDEIPDNLVVGLKRFRYELGAEKINDRFDYPPHIDMAPYTVHFGHENDAKPDSDMFELVGVVIHQGTLDFGHYWSYVKDHKTYGQREGIWHRIEDSLTRLVDLKTVIEEGRGGKTPGRSGLWLNERPDNAYVLFYRRIGSTPQLNGFAEPTKGAPKPVSDALKDDNKHALETAYLFDPACQYYLCGLMLKGRTDCTCPQCGGDYERAAILLGLEYLLRISVKEQKLLGIGHLCGAIQAAVERNQHLAPHAVRFFFDQDNAALFLYADKSSARNKINELITALMAVASVADPIRYGSASSTTDFVDDIMGATLLSHIESTLHFCFRGVLERRHCIPTFFSLLQNIAFLGPVETRFVAQTSFLQFAIELLFVGGFTETTNQYPEIELAMKEKKGNIRWESIIDFVNFGLTHLVKYRTGGEPRQENMDSVNGTDLVSPRLYQSEEIEKLLTSTCVLKRSNCTILSLSHQWAPSRLMATLMSANFDPQYGSQTASSLCILISYAQWHHDFCNYTFAAVHVCASPDIVPEIKTKILEAVLIEAHEDDSFAETSIEWIELVADNIPGSIDAVDNVLAWARQLIFCKWENIRRDMAALMQKIAAADKKPTKGSLAERLTSDEVLIAFLANIRETTETGRVYPESRLKSSMDAFVSIFGCLYRRTKDYIPCALSEGRTALEKMVMEKYMDDAEMQARIVSTVQFVFDNNDVSERYKRFAARNGWRLSRPGRGQKRDSTELEDNGDTVQIKLVRSVGQGDGAAEEMGDWSDESEVTSDQVEYESTGGAVNTDAEIDRGGSGLSGVEDSD